MNHTAAQLIVKCLEAHQVDYVFGIPGAKIDAVFDALEDSPIELIVCRHEQNAAFIASCYGRLTGNPGVVLVTSGPGVSNLATGLLTATTEGDPVIAIGGDNPKSMRHKEMHQTSNNVALMQCVTKSAVSVILADNIPEVVNNAFRVACTPKNGACYINLPQDLLTETTSAQPLTPSNKVCYGAATQETITHAEKQLNQAQYPVVILGLEASNPDNVESIRALIKKTSLPTVGTFQSAGVIPKELFHCFAGRIGLFKNQPADKLLDQADVILAIGFNPIEYNPNLWNKDDSKTIIHLDYLPQAIRHSYQPSHELLGNIKENVLTLTKQLDEGMSKRNLNNIQPFKKEYNSIINKKIPKQSDRIHPLCFIKTLQEIIDPNTIVICDIGTIYIWMARYFHCHEPRHLLFSNGQQTLGVALPWAIGAKLARPEQTIISMSGDGAFLFSANELETAVRLKQRLIHFIWRDGSYNMVKEQQMLKYKRESGIRFGDIDIPHFAKAFGAIGYTVAHPSDLKATMLKALTHDLPVLIDIPIDYSGNPELFKSYRNR
jgi:acetolactate synthase-1/2/3 large subunit